MSHSRCGSWKIPQAAHIASLPRASFMACRSAAVTKKNPRTSAPAGSGRSALAWLRGKLLRTDDPELIVVVERTGGGIRGARKVGQVCPGIEVALQKRGAAVFAGDLILPFHPSGRVGGRTLAQHLHAHVDGEGV